MSAERIKALEIHQENSAEVEKDTRERLTRIEQKLDGIESTLASQRGYIAGAMSVIVLIWSGIVAVVVAAWDTIIDRFQDMWL
jgi:hypothetical protein